MLEPRCVEVEGGITFKVILVSFHYIYIICAIFKKSLYFLTYPRTHNSLAVCTLSINMI